MGGRHGRGSRARLAERPPEPSRTLNETCHIDYQLFNYYVSTNPRSPFTTRPYAQKFSVDSLRVLDGTTLTVTRPGGASETRTLAPEEVPGTLAEDFGIVLDRDDASRLVKANLDV